MSVDSRATRTDFAFAVALTLSLSPLLAAGCGDGPEGEPGTCNDTCSYANDGACDDGGEGSAFGVCALGSDCADCGPRGASVSDELLAFDAAATAVVVESVALIDGAWVLDAALTSADDAATDSALDAWDASLGRAQLAVLDLEAAEDGIRASAEDAGVNIATAALLPALAFGAVVYGLWSFVDTLKTKSNEMSALRAERDQALDDVGNGVSDAEVRYQQKKSEMTSKGQEVLQEIGSKITTDLVTAPLPAGTIGQLIFKEAAGTALGEGLKVISGTSECESGASASGCKLGISKTDASGAARVPTGTVTASASGPGVARVLVERVVVADGQSVDVTRPRVAPETATASDVPGLAEDPGGGGDGVVSVGDPCSDAEPCVPGSVCFNEFCVGSGLLHVSLGFTADSDFDLHLLTPNGNEISYSNRSGDGGTLDVDQCVTSCGTGSHAENIVFTESAPPGEYSAFVVNYDGRAGGDFRIEVAGSATQAFAGSLPASAGAASETFRFQTP